MEGGFAEHAWANLLCVRAGLLRRLRCLGNVYVYALDLLYDFGVLATAMRACWTCSAASVSWRRLCVRAGLSLRCLRRLGDGYVCALDCSTASVSWRRLCVRAGRALRLLCLGDLLYGFGVLAKGKPPLAVLLQKLPAGARTCQSCQLVSTPVQHPLRTTGKHTRSSAPPQNCIQAHQNCIQAHQLISTPVQAHPRRTVSKPTNW